MPTQANDAVTQALSLRTKALGLLQEAKALDGKNPFIVVHVFEDGVSPYVLWSTRQPTENEAASVLDFFFEPDLGESLVIEEAVTLEEMTGVMPMIDLEEDRREQGG